MKPNENFYFARKLRKEMTLPERLLWNMLKTRMEDGLVFRRQYPFDKYVCDFYCAKANVIIEIDGNWAHSMGNAPQNDKIRDEFLKSKGFEILRFEAKTVLKNPDEVADNIRRYCFAKFLASQK